MDTDHEILSNIKQDLSTANTADSANAVQEANYVDRDVDRDIKLELLITKKEFNKQLEQNRIERKKYAKHIFWFTCIWATIILAILVSTGFKKYTGFELSDKVLITVITSTTVNSFGFFLLVVKYLFNTGEKEKSDDEKRKTKEKVTKNKISKEGE